jgi:hypothetical protein
MQLISLSGKDKVTSAAAYERPVTELVVSTTPSARKKLTQVALTGKDLDAHRGKRARAGTALPDKAVALGSQATLGDAVAPVVTEPVVEETSVPIPEPTTPPREPLPGAMDFGDSDDI